MPTAMAPNARAVNAVPDDLDNLLDYDNAVQDFWKDLPDAEQRNVDEPIRPQQDMDEEVVVAKKRKPNPKLDDARLFSAAGIPKLRRTSKDRLRFSGKGHEFSDISRMLNLYQLWLDDLYPKAKFRDALTMVEKLGHSKRMQVSRRAWMEECRASKRREDEPMEDAGVGASTEVVQDDDPIFPERDAAPRPGHGSGEQTTRKNDAPDDDELDELFAEEARSTHQSTHGAAPSDRNPFADDDEPDDDELDVLMAEGSASQFNPHHFMPTRRAPFEEDDDPDQDELDALLAEEVRPPPKVVQPAKNDRFADEEEVMDAMAGEM